MAAEINNGHVHTVNPPSQMQVVVRVDTKELNEALARAARYLRLRSVERIEQDGGGALACAVVAGAIVGETASTKVSRRGLLSWMWGGRR